MKYHPKYCTYIPLLMRALAEIEGDVLEMGTGIVSTHVLHWMCLDQGRRLVSYENSPYYYEIAKACEGPLHSVRFVERWADAEIERAVGRWAVALVDHAPAERRHVDVERLANCAGAIVIHDSQGLSEKHYHYQKIYPLFRYRLGWGKARPSATVLSNFVDVRKWEQ